VTGRLESVSVWRREITRDATQQHTDSIRLQSNTVRMSCCVQLLISTASIAENTL